MIDIQYLRAKEVLEKNAKGHNILAERLLEKEVLFTEDLEEIFGARPGEKPAEIEDTDEMLEIEEKTETVVDIEEIKETPKKEEELKAPEAEDKA